MSDILVGIFTANKSLSQLTIAGHGLLNGDTVRFALGAVNNNLPAPLVVGTWYYVVNATPDTFQVASTSGGAFIVLINVGTGHNEAWSPAPTKKVWSYKVILSAVKAPDFMPDISEVNYYAERGWEVMFMDSARGDVTFRFWWLLRKQE